MQEFRDPYLRIARALAMRSPRRARIQQVRVVMDTPDQPAEWLAQDRRDEAQELGDLRVFRDERGCE